MTALKIVLMILLIFLLISLIRVGLVAEYTEAGFALRVRVGPLRITVLPMKKKKPRQERKEEETLPPAQQPEPQKKGGVAKLAFDLVKPVIEAGGRLRRKIRIDRLELVLTVASTDPAKTAICYGQANAVLGTIWYPMQQAFQVKDAHFHTEASYDQTKPTLYFWAAVSLTIGQGIVVMFPLGCKALARVLRYRQEQKAEKTQQIKKTEDTKREDKNEIPQNRKAV